MVSPLEDMKRPDISFVKKDALDAKHLYENLQFMC